MRKILIILAVLSLSYSCQEKKEVVEKKVVAHIDKQSLFFIETVRLLL